jgi:uncharacterized membrane protein YraQ (UPF0718 family)
MIRRALSQLPWLVTAFLLLAGLLNFAGLMWGSLPAWAVQLLDGLRYFSAVFLGIFIEAVPFLLIGTLGSGVVEVFLTRDELAAWTPKTPFLSALTGSLLGLFLPVCECGVVPFSRRLMRKGLPVPAGIATLFAAPALNPIVIASTLAAFGPGLIFWGRLAATLCISTLMGWVFAKIPHPERIFRFDRLALETDFTAARPTFIAPAAGLADRSTRPAFSAQLRQVLLVSADEFFEMGRYLVAGAVLAALMQTMVNQSALLALGQGPILSVLVMIALAVLLSVCSTVDAFIALAFTGTFLPGAILAFLVYGPMVDIKSTLMFLRVFKPKTVILLVSLPLLLTFVLGGLMNMLWKGGFF